MSLKIGVPSKGRLMEQTFQWFGTRGIAMRQTGAEREYAGAVEGIDGVELVLLSAGEVPRELAAGRIQLGVTGSDLVRDRLVDWADTLAELAPLGFGQADLVIAVPNAWIDVDSQGATEGTVKNLTAEAIADITSSGATLRDNHLKILGGSLIHQSQAVLYLAKTADWSHLSRATLDDLASKLNVTAPL